MALPAIVLPMTPLRLPQQSGVVGCWTRCLSPLEPLAHLPEQRVHGVPKMRVGLTPRMVATEYSSLAYAGSNCALPGEMTASAAGSFERAAQYALYRRSP